MFAKVHAVAKQVGEIVVGKDVQIRQALVCLLAGGHLLIEDVPGVGKTTLAVSYTHLTLPTTPYV